MVVLIISLGYLALRQALRALFPPIESHLDWRIIIVVVGTRRVVLAAWRQTRGRSVFAFKANHLQLA